MEGNRQTFLIENFPWDTGGYRPRTVVTLTRLPQALKVQFVSWESPVRAVETENNTDVYCDSCVEMFIQPNPEEDHRYMNVECNPNAAVYCAVNTPGGDRITLPGEVIESFQAKTAVYVDRWEAELSIPAKVLQEIFPGYAHRAGVRIRGNFYKCGDKTAHPHFGCWQPIDWPEPNFHLPQFFGDIIL